MVYTKDGGLVSELISRFEKAKMLVDRGDFHLALDIFKNLADQYFLLREFGNFFECQYYIVRIGIEQGEATQVQLAKDNLIHLVSLEDLEIPPKILFVLARCASFDDNLGLAQYYLDQCLQEARFHNLSREICLALCGLAINYCQMNKLDSSLRYLEEFNRISKENSYYELTITAERIRGRIQKALKNFDGALHTYWQCFEQIRNSKSLMDYIGLLYELGNAYLDIGDQKNGAIYLQLALASMDPVNMKSLHNAIQKRLKSLDAPSEPDWDIVFVKARRLIIEKEKGEIDLKNQVLLFNVFELFFENPGFAYSKEQLVKIIWNEDYNPGIHDNKIYVTIKRLRELIEPNYERPKYIIRSKNGYFLSKYSKVMINSKRSNEIG